MWPWLFCNKLVIKLQHEMVLESAQNQIKVWPKLLVEMCELELNLILSTMIERIFWYEISIKHVK